jgi:hypothetical protein
MNQIGFHASEVGIPVFSLGLMRSLKSRCHHDVWKEPDKNWILRNWYKFKTQHNTVFLFFGSKKSTQFSDFWQKVKKCCSSQARRGWAELRAVLQYLYLPGFRVEFMGCSGGSNSILFGSWGTAEPVLFSCLPIVLTMYIMWEWKKKKETN